jgi:hypothetical protein
MNVLSTVLTTVILMAALAACAPENGNPSPGAMAEPPTAEALEPHYADQPETRGEFDDAMAFAERRRLAELSLGEMMVALGERYMGRPYIVGPLDGFGREVLVARLDSFDCFTYVEALLAMARGIEAGDTSFEGYLRRTEEQRYRDGRMEDYCSRLHYFTDWIHTNAERGIVRDVTREVGGEPFAKQYGFMGANRESYPALEDEDQFRCVQRVEEELNRTVDLFYIPQDRISESYAMLRQGDLLSMSTHIEGLDVTHTGLAYANEDGTFGLLHASTDGGVRVNPDLQEYVRSIRVQNGIIVARPVAGR